jgi:hypothetical protein
MKYGPNECNYRFTKVLKTIYLKNKKEYFDSINGVALIVLIDILDLAKSMPVK